ncbi:MAG: pyridoxamine 5'-phosphate oxidase family protein [Paludibacter sp.]|jgi:general stress protein 26|nr:pyridoxamine 5'-phosphate oxidase family protein [Paludibacter sp.]
MNITEKQAECLKVMESLSVVDFTTIDKNGFPSTRAMLNLRNKAECPSLTALYEVEQNPLTVYLTTNTSSEKIGEIQQNGKASLYFCNSQAFHGVLLQGTVEIITDNDFRQKVWQKGWEIYYPEGDSDYSVLRFVPNKLKVYSNFSIVTETI